MNNNLGTSTFWRPCDENGICHCDWRLTIYYCEEEPAMKYIYIVNAVLSGFVGFVGRCREVTEGICILNCICCVFYSMYTSLSSRRQSKANLF